MTSSTQMIYPYKDQVTLILKLCDHCKNHGFQIWVPKAGRDRTSTNRLRNTGALRTVADFRNKKWTHFLRMIFIFFIFCLKIRWSPVNLQPVKHAEHPALKAQVVLALHLSRDKCAISLFGWSCYTHITMFKSFIGPHHALVLAAA